MIIVRLSGGLGNQLFQYALARALKAVTNQSVKIDAGFLFGDQTGLTKRFLRIDAFKISVPFADADDLAVVGVAGKNWLGRSWFSLKNKMMPWRYKTVIHDTGFVFDPRVLSVTGNKYLMGNWLSPKYFGEICDILAAELVLLKPFGERAQKFLTQINTSEAVAVHVRRGDYLKYPKLGVCSLEYYQAAIDLIKSKTTNPTFFIFSDDVDYVRQSFGLANEVVYVSDQGLTDVEELVLMSKCHHQIIANSSFSWWAAWLNQSASKIVIAPKKFRADGKDTSDYVSTSLGWIRL